MTSPCVDTSRAAEYYYFGGSYEEVQHPKRVIRPVKKSERFEPLLSRRKCRSFFLPPVILVTYHYWRCPCRTRSWSTQFDQGRNAKRRWATTLSARPQELSRLRSDVLHQDAGCFVMPCRSSPTSLGRCRHTPVYDANRSFTGAALLELRKRCEENGASLVSRLQTPHRLVCDDQG